MGKKKDWKLGGIKTVTSNLKPITRMEKKWD